MSGETDVANKQIEIYDTTLRDGSQLEGISLTVEDKLRIAEQLDWLGVHYIEAGWPGANVFSVGDALMLLGVLLVLHAAAGSRLAPLGRAQRTFAR